MATADECRHKIDSLKSFLHLLMLFYLFAWKNLNKLLLQFKKNIMLLTQSYPFLESGQHCFNSDEIDGNPRKQAGSIVQKG